MHSLGQPRHLTIFLLFLAQNIASGEIDVMDIYFLVYLPSWGLSFGIMILKVAGFGDEGEFMRFVYGLLFTIIVIKFMDAIKSCLFFSGAQFKSSAVRMHNIYNESFWFTF